ncbi:helix-turn-helix domain-containing protein [Pseudomonas japonica]|uniref:helix-turn-helix domain-containing protein n=1 Tax=Pseudomonas japonica TaxID=256466 RepID=UPI0015E35634|nr:helix-turn-helix transcriptional regulator [Pseudomonas japonica]MBA1289162.1 helix-turn-helix transcriptional regulator [Pseudomonas japonica]
MNIGDRLKEERLRLGFNQADFAALAGVAKTSQFNYEKGDRSPDAEYLARVLEAGADILYVVSGSRAPTSSGLSDAEALLVKRYRAVAVADRQAVDRILEVMAAAV